ncbi:MAG: bifunctional phosphoglucose/phosphomannose isomerase [bacterium]|nr:bifunctional phosphoglucose/phosphomannose isomerase [bacterium]
MDMHESIKKFNEQFRFNPEIKNRDNFKPTRKFIIAGMGGSNIASDFLWIYRPELEIISHRSYGLPIVKNITDYTVIVSSYSGNTEEAVNSYNEARDKGLSVILITVGGKLLELAKEQDTPYIQMPDTGIQPRMALGFSFMAMLKALSDEDGLREANKLTEGLNLDSELAGKSLAEKIEGKIPIIYSSTINGPLARDWKINFNENGKIPAFFNIWPELNHNEMTGFGEVKELSNNFYFIFLKDLSDLPQIQNRMDITSKLFSDKNLAMENVVLDNDRGLLYKIFSSVILSLWASYYTAKNYGLDPEKVPMVEEFKRLIKP